MRRMGHLGAGVLDDEDGGVCVGYRWLQVDPEEAEALQQDAWDALDHLLETAFADATPQDCPIDPADDLPQPMVRDAVREVVVDQLPRPEPEIPPGHAITGLPAYLVTNHTLDYGPVEHDVDVGVLDVTVRVTGTATSTVDWGDGTGPVTYEQPGRPYPDGQVRHAYADKGVVDITITDRWEVAFEVVDGGVPVITDTIALELDPVTVDDFAIQEVRAVRTAPTG